MLTNNISLYNPFYIHSWLFVKRYYAMNYTFFKMEPHYHSELEIMYAVHGGCKVSCRKTDLLWETFSLKEGEYILIDCNTVHRLEVIRGTPCRILNLEITLVPSSTIFSLDYFSQGSVVLHEFLNTPSLVRKGIDDGGSLCRTILELQKQLQSNIDRSEQGLEANLLLAQLFIELSRQRIKKHTAYQGSIYVRRALSYIDKNYDNMIGVENIATAAGISLSHLQRLFKNHTGNTLIDRVNELRIKKARLLLETSSLPIIDIAIMVGFHNRQHFSCIFRKLTGCSPSLYKKRKGNSQLWLGFDSAALE